MSLTRLNFSRFFRSNKKRPFRKNKEKRADLRVEMLEDRVVPAAFMSGDLAILDLASSSATNTTGSVLELNPAISNPSGGVQGLISIPSTGPNAFKFSASGTSSYISTTSDGSLLAIAGYNTTSSVTDLASLSGNVRGVETYNGSASESSSPVALFSDTGGGTNQTRAATSADDTTWYITGKSGIATNGSTPPFPLAQNTGAARSFGGTVYIATTRTGGSNATTSAIMTASGITNTPSPSVTVAGLSGVPQDANISDFYLIQSGHFAGTYDVLYQLDGSTITKFSLQSVGGSWQSNGIATLSGPAGLSLVAAANGSGADLYYTTGSTAVHVTDSTGWSSSASGFSLSSPTTLYTVTGTGGDSFLKGIAFVPTGGALATATTTDVPTVTPTGTQPYGTSETFSAVVHASTGGTPPTAGSVTFMSGSTVLATATTDTPSGTQATFTVSSTTVPVGTYASGTITAVYNAGTGFSGSTSSASTQSLTITGTATTTAAPTFNPTTATVDAPVSFSAVVTASSGSAAPTAGSVTFMSGSTVLATSTTETTSGTHATFTVSTNSIPVGTYSNVTAVYSGNGAFLGSTSPAGGTLTVNPVTVPAGSLAQWTFENQPISGAPPFNNTPTPDVGVGTADAIGMTNSYNSTTSTNSDDILAGVGGDTGSNTLADTSQIWRVRGQTPGNGWSSQAPIGTQGAQFFTSTAGYSGPINISFDWYATTQGEANLQLEYTTDGGTTWHNVPVTVPAGVADVAALTNSSSPNTVMGSYVQMSGGQQWAQGLTATINDPAAANDSGFGIELVNASTGADDIAAAGTPLNNTSGNWRFDNVDVAAPQVYTPGNLVILQGGDGVTNYNAQAPVFLNEVNPGQTNQVTISGTTADTLGNVTVTTTGTQNFTAGQWVQISGVEVGSNVNSQYNGVFSILSVNNSGNTFTYFNQLAANLGAGTAALMTGSASGGAWASVVVQQTSVAATAGQGAAGINSVTTSNGGLTVTVNTSTTNLFTTGETIAISGVTPAGYNGDVTITRIDANNFSYTLSSPISGTITLSNAQATPIQNAPVTLDLSAAAGNGQLNRTADGSGLSFGGVDSTINNGGLTGGLTPTGSDNRVEGVVSGNPNIPADINTTTFGPYYVGDDNRGAVGLTPTGPLYSAGHPNQAGGAVSQGAHEFDTEGPSIGNQVSASTNVRGVTIGFDNRMYLSTASGLGGTAALNAAGIFTEAQALPNSSTPTPANDIMVVPALFGASKLGGIWLADMNGDGILDNGDRLYFVDDGTVGHAGTGGVYVATWNTANTNNAWNTPNNAAAVAAGYTDYWSLPVRLGDAPVQVGSGGVGQLRGITGTVLNSTTALIYTSAYDDVADPTSGDASVIQQWNDSNTGLSITDAKILTGTTVQITVNGTVPVSWNGQLVEVDGVGASSGAPALTSGYNGSWVITRTGSNTFTYSDTNSGASSLSEVTNQGATDVTVSSDLSQASLYSQFGIGTSATTTFGGTIIETADAGSVLIGGKNVGDVGLRGVSFAPVAATTVVLSQSPSNPLTPGTGVTLTATLTNTQVGNAGLQGDTVTFIDENTNTILGQSTVNSGVASLNLPTGVVGDHYVKAYFAGGGTLALAPATSNTIQIIEAGDVDDWTSLATSCPVGAGVGSPVTFTATVHPSAYTSDTLGASDTVSFYSGSVSTANLLGTTLVNSGTGIATLVTPFSALGSYSIIAVFNGDNNFESSQISLTQHVGANATGTISSSANNVALNATPTYTATVVGNSTVGTPSGTVTFQLVSATTLAVVGTSSAVTLTGSGNSLTATWTSPALASPGSYFVTFTYTPAGGIQYNGFTIDTISSTSGTAFVETVKQAFTPGNLVAVQRGDGNINLGSSGYLLFLDEYTTGGTLVQRIALPNLDAGTAHALLLGGQNGNEGLLNRSANGAYLTVEGYDVPVGHTFLTSTFPYQFPRTIALESGAGGTPDTSTSIGIANPSGSGVAAAISSASATGTGTGKTVTITLSTANYFLPGESVTISGVSDSAYDGTFTIVSVASNNKSFTFTDPNSITTTTPTVSSATASSPASVPYNPTDVVSVDGTQFYMGSTLANGDTTDSGILYVGTVGTSTASEIGPLGTGSVSLALIGGQLYSLTAGGHLSAVGSGEPTSIGQSATPLPSFFQNYNLFFPGAENAEQVLALNTTDGSTINPNVLYVADQALGILKFTLFSASNVHLSDDGTGTVTATYTGGSTLVAGQYVNIANALDPTFDGNFIVTSASSGTFTFSRGGTTMGSTTGATATEWLYGDSSGTGSFGQKLIFAGGATAITGYVTGSSVQLYVTGVNVTQANPNQLDSWLDTNGATAGFTSGNVTKLAFVGGTPTSNPASPNGNMNFAGLAFAPGYATNTAVAVTGNATSGYTVTATVTDPTGGGNVPTGAVYFYLDGSSTPYASQPLNGSGVATLPIGAGVLTGEHSFTAVYQGDVKDDQSTGVSGQAFGAGNIIATVQAVGANANATAASVSEFPTTGGAAVQTIYLPTQGTGELTLKGNSTTEGYISDSADGHSASFGGYLTDAGLSTSGANSAIAQIGANGSVNTTTQIANADLSGSVRATISADGLGFWVAGSNYLRYVPFGNSTSTTSTEVSNYYPSPSTVEISNGNNQFGPPAAGTPGALYITGAAGSPGGGLSSIDGPAEVVGGLATVPGQAEDTLGNGGGTDFNTGRDTSGNFPVTNQIAVSPDGLTILVADSRIDGSGGILEYYDSLGSGNWTLKGQAQVTGTTDNGLRGLVVDWSTNTAYATTTAGSEIVKIAGITTSGATPTFSFTTVETAAAGTAFDGVAFAPTAPPATPATTTTLTVSGSPGAYPGGVTLSASVTGSSPTGYVSFRTSTGVEIGAAPLVSGMATLTPSSDLLAGSYTGLVAVYTGDANNAPSTSTPQSATVSTGPTTTALTVQFTNVATNVTDNLSAQVSYTGSNAAPTGTVTFWQDGVGSGTNLGTATVTPTVVNVGGTPTLEFLASGVSTKYTTTGSHTITAVYSGDSNFATSQASQGVTVVASPTVVVTTSNANPANTSASVTETVTVSGGSGTPTGYVQFYDNLVPIGSPVHLSSGAGTVTLTTSATQGTDGSGNQFLLPGTQSITAVYSGDANYFSGTGVYQQAVQANAFGAGDKFVYRVGDGINSLDAPTGSSVSGAIGSTIYIDEIPTSGPNSGTVVQSIILPANDGTAASGAKPDQRTIHAVVGNGQQSTTEQLTVDAAGSALWLTGYDTNPLLGATVSADGTTVSGQGTLAPGIPTVSGSITRSVARITTAGVVQDVTMSKANSGSSFGNFNAVFSPDGNQFYTAGNGGVVYFSSFTPSSGTVTPTATMTSPTGTTTALENDGGNLAVVGAPGFGNDGPQVYTGFPTSAASINNLPGFSDTNATGGGQASTFYIDAYFTHLDNAGHTAPAGINTFYLSDDGPSFAGGAITKWSLVGGTWVVTDHITAPGSAPNPISYYYIAGQTLSEGPGSSAVGNVTLYVTYGNGGNADTGPGQLFSITDNSGYDATGLTAGSVIIQTGAASKEVYRGVALFPTTDLTGSATPITTAVEGTSGTFPLATFTDPDDTSTPEPLATYAASITWGDGTTSPGTITYVSTDSGGSHYSVSGTHTYGEDTASGHMYPVGITVSDSSWGGNLILSTTATVADAVAPFNDITVTGVTPTVTNGIMEATAFTAQVATFTDPIDYGGSPDAATNYTATINWGDGSSSAGTIVLTNSGAVYPASGIYTVTGTHTYPEDTVTAYTITVTVSSTEADDQNAMGTTTATVLDCGSPNDIIVTGTPITTAVEGTSFTLPVGTFTDPYSNGGTANPASTFSVTINWGDGTASSAGTVTLTSSTSGTGYFYTATYSVSGTHTYAEDTATPYPISITVNGDDSGTAALGSSSATVGDATAPFTDLVGTTQNFSATQGTPFTGTVATFTDPIDFGGSAGTGDDTAAHYSVTINWGPGEGTSAGTVTLNNPGAVYPALAMYTVTGTHTYVNSGSIAVSVTISATAPDTDDQNLVVNDTATVAPGGTPISISSFVVNGSAATGVSASEVTNTVTIQTGASLGFYPGEQVIISGFTGTTGYNGLYTIASIVNSGMGFTYNDTNVTSGAADVNGTATPALFGSVASPSADANERSKVNSIVITFNQPVSISGTNTAFGLAQRAFTKNGVAGTLQGDTTTTVNYISYDGGTVWVLTFSGGTVAGGSISDGDYNITLDHTMVTGGGGLAADYTNNFHRLFGDINGNGLVQNAANLKFRASFGSHTTDSNYLAAFDYSSVGQVGNAANLQFRNRFGSSWTSL